MHRFGSSGYVGSALGLLALIVAFGMVVVPALVLGILSIKDERNNGDKYYTVYPTKETYDSRREFVSLQSPNANPDSGGRKPSGLSGGTAP